MPIKRKARGGKLRRQVTDLFDLPAEVMLDLPLVSLIGLERMQIENHRGIIEYTATRIRVNTTAGVIRIEGEGLLVHDIGTDAICIDGTIRTISFVL